MTLLLALIAYNVGLFLIVWGFGLLLIAGIAKVTEAKGRPTTIAGHRPHATGRAPGKPPSGGGSGRR